ncbi:MAG: hypothetical protein KAY37_03125 [Phycisphaerae bacterium]|nr:hypothetical protein [Phycisphaerae bacterium]
MNAQTQTECVAVVCDRDGGDAPAMEAFLTAQGLADAEWFAPRDVDEVDQAVCTGRVRRVVFPTETQLLEALWNNEIAFEHWLASDLRLEFVKMCEPTSAAHVEAVFESWRRWQRRHRRRQFVAGIILSIVAIVAAFVLLLIRN